MRHWSGRLSKWPRAQLTPPPTPLPPPPIPTLLFLLFGRPTRRLARKPPGALPHEICIIAMDYRDTRNVAEKFLTVCEPPLTIRTKRWRETDDVRVKRFTFFLSFFFFHKVHQMEKQNRDVYSSRCIGIQHIFQKNFLRKEKIIKPTDFQVSNKIKILNFDFQIFPDNIDSRLI